MILNTITALTLGCFDKRVLTRNHQVFAIKGARQVCRKRNKHFTKSEKEQVTKGDPFLAIAQIAEQVFKGLNYTQPLAGMFLIRDPKQTNRSLPHRVHFRTPHTYRRLFKCTDLSNQQPDIDLLRLIRPRTEQ